MKFTPYPYQRRALEWILEHPSCGLFLEMGLGKTAITLTAVNELIYNRFEVERALVVAPLRVADTVWAEEAAKWDHLRRLRVSKVLGSPRRREEALRWPADVYVINRENVAWLVGYLQEHKLRWPFDMVVLDELSSFKNPGSQRFKALRRVRPAMARVVGLTGTPAPNGLIDLWSQVYLLDRGARLGRTLTGYRQRYFYAVPLQQRVAYTPRPETPAAVSRLLADLCVSMKAEDYLTLPERMDQTVSVRLPEAAMRRYQALERDLVLPLQDTVITAQTAAVVAGKLLQLANGAVYDEDREIHVLHDAKLDALEDLIEAANGQPVLVYYAYQHDLSRIRERFPSARVLKTAEDAAAWNRGEAPLMLAHPDSAGHGLNLQQGGHLMVWFGLTWSLEKYQQASARLHRQGQKEPVTVFHLVAQGTIDEDVMRALAGKERRQDALMNAVRARMEQTRGEGKEACTTSTFTRQRAPA